MQRLTLAKPLFIHKFVGLKVQESIKKNEITKRNQNLYAKHHQDEIYLKRKIYIYARKYLQESKK